MASQTLAGLLWLIAGVSRGGIAFFLVDPLHVAIFIGGAVLAMVLAVAMLARPSPAWVAWVLAFGLAGAVIGYARRSQPAWDMNPLAGGGPDDPG